MSAIAGIVYFGEQPINRSLVQRMGVAGSMYGRDTAGEWFDDRAGFIYRGSTTTPDSAHEQQPYRDPESGIVVLIDGHVHARQELREACTASGYSPRTDADPELVLRAYQAWGEDCAARMLGEYGIAIWDPVLRRLVCLRDAAGVRPFFYAQAPDGSFRFATVASQLLSDPDFPRQPDIPGMIDFAATRGAGDPERTPFRAIRRLRAAHALVASARGVRVQRYWSFDDEVDRAIDGGDHSSACSHALISAIRDRVGGVAPLGISLSGGHDSSALFVLWQWLRAQGEPLAPPRVSSYYWRYPEADERARVQELLEHWPARSSITDLTGQTMLAGIDEHSRQLGMPETSIGWSWQRHQGGGLREAGVRTVVTGDEGNSVAQASPLRIADLAKEGRLIAAFAQAQQWSLEVGETTVWVLRLVSDLAARAAFPGPTAALGRLRRRFRAPARSVLCQPPQAGKILGNRAAPTRRRGVAWSESLADAHQRRSLALGIDRLFILPGNGWDLEGVTVSTPYLDRRVVVSFLAGMAAEHGSRHTRALLESVVRRTARYQLRGSYAYIDRPVLETVRSELNEENSLMSASALIELGVVDRQGLGAYLAQFDEGRVHIDFFLWALLSLEAWARCWVVND